MTQEELHQHIRKRALAGVYYLYGEEEYLIDRDARAIASVALGAGDESFNFSILWGDERAPSEIAPEVVSQANAFPFMAEKRVVLVRKAQKLLSDAGIAAYVQNPSPDTVLILTAETLPRSAKRKASPKAAVKDVFDTVAYLKDVKNVFRCDVTVEYKSLKDQAALALIQREFKALGHAITPGALATFHMLKGNAARELVGEVNKIHVALPDKGQIDEDDVFTYLGASRSSNLFALAEKVLERNLREAEEIAMTVLDSTSATGIVAWLSKQFSLLWQVPPIDRGAKSDAEARAIGLNFGWQYDALKKLRHLYKSDSEFEKIFEYLLAADRELKSRNNVDQLVISRLLVQIIVESRRK